LKIMIDEIITNSNGMPIVFPIHPRTAKVFKENKIGGENLIIIEPLSYLEFNFLVNNAKAVITDSGGITEETTILGIPCITLRDNTERPETVTEGTNELIGSSIEKVASTMDTLFSGKWKKGGVPELWDGRAAERIVNTIISLYEKEENINN